MICDDYGCMYRKVSGNCVLTACIKYKNIPGYESLLKFPCIIAGVKFETLRELTEWVNEHNK